MKCAELQNRDTRATRFGQSSRLRESKHPPSLRLERAIPSNRARWSRCAFERKRLARRFEPASSESSGGRAIDFVFRKDGQLLVCGSFFGEILLQDLSAIRAAQRFRPGDQRPIPSHLVMLDRLR
jgi:hypothetical protein